MNSKFIVKKFGKFLKHLHFYMIYNRSNFDIYADKTFLLEKLKFQLSNPLMNNVFYHSRIIEKLSFFKL